MPRTKSTPASAVLPPLFVPPLSAVARLFAAEHSRRAGAATLATSLSLSLPPPPPSSSPSSSLSTTTTTQATAAFSAQSPPGPVTVHARNVYLLPRRPRGRPLDSPNFSAELRRLERLHAAACEFAAADDDNDDDDDDDDEDDDGALQAIAGCDEAGAGCLAGPVVAAAALLPAGVLFEGLDDSKRLSPARRAEVLCNLRACSDVRLAVGVVDPRAVDAINIRQARLLAMRKAVDGLLTLAQPAFLILDGTDTLPEVALPLSRQRAVVGGDGLCAAVAAASIVAKETRDALMRAAHEEYPLYQFDAHKGYGTAQHLAALMKYGPCPLHRLSFKPVALAASLHPKVDAQRTLDG